MSDKQVSEKSKESDELVDMKPDRLKLAHGQSICCEICKREFETTATECYICVPPFGIDLSLRCVTCNSCWNQIRFKIGEEGDISVVLASSSTAVTINQSTDLSQLLITP